MPIVNVRRNLVGTLVVAADEPGDRTQPAPEAGLKKPFSRHLPCRKKRWLSILNSGTRLQRDHPAIGEAQLRAAAIAGDDGLAAANLPPLLRPRCALRRSLP